MDWNDLLSALALVMVIEGLMPFANPEGSRRAMLTIAQLPARALRITGLVSILAGLALLYIVRG